MRFAPNEAGFAKEIPPNHIHSVGQHSSVSCGGRCGQDPEGTQARRLLQGVSCSREALVEGDLWCSILIRLVLRELT